MMNINDIIKLIDAGFTADEIKAMAAASVLPQDQKDAAPATASPDSIIEVSPEDVRPTENNPTVKQAASSDPDILAAINQRFDDIEAKLKQAASPSLSDVKPQGIDDIISKFFKED